MSQLVNKLIVSNYPDIKNVSSQLNKAKSDEVVFYNLVDNKIFLERLKQSKSSLVFVNRDIECSDSRVKVLTKENYIELLHQSLDHFYPLDSNKKFIAVTGTNGKTSTVHLLSQIIQQQQKNVLSIGTLGCNVNGKVVRDDGLTTPGVCELRRVLFECKDDYDYVVMETSSHALEQDRMHGLQFAVAGWTNLTQDHLDYHKTMQAYFESKLKIVNQLDAGAKLIVANKDLFDQIKKHSSAVDLIINNFQNEIPIELRSPFMRLNLALAVSMAKAIGINTIEYSTLTAPPGRFQTIEHQGKVAIVDYAHTPDALENACAGVHAAYAKAQLIVVFGCGGDRDRGKRPLMAKAVEANADVVIVTSDNPRSEDPEQIINDIIAGFTINNYITEVDRRSAIAKALAMVQPGDVVLVAGKGHESYQEINGVRHPFDDFSIIKEIWN